MGGYNTIVPRTLAIIIDAIITLPILGLAAFVMPFFTKTASIIYAAQVLAGLIIVSYYVVMHARNGQTIGKKTCKVKVVNTSEEKITLQQSIIRSIPQIIQLFGLLFIQIIATTPNYPFYEFVILYGEKTILIAIILWIVASFVIITSNEKDRSIHDFFAKTVVIKT